MELQLTVTDQGKKSLKCDGYGYRVDKMLVITHRQFPGITKMG
jgi:hypothetical protein